MILFVLPDSTVGVSLNQVAYVVSLYVGYISACPYSTYGLVLKNSALKTIVLLLLLFLFLLLFLL
jgi:hypothetical protein